MTIFITCWYVIGFLCCLYESFHDEVFRENYSWTAKTLIVVLASCLGPFLLYSVIKGLLKEESGW